MLEKVHLRECMAVDESMLQQVHLEVSVAVHKAMLEHLKASVVMDKSMTLRVHP